MEIVWVELWRPELLAPLPRRSASSRTVRCTPNNISGRNQKHQREMISNNIKEALQKHQDEGPALIVGDWNIKTLNYVATDALTTSLTSLASLSSFSHIIRSLSSALLLEAVQMTSASAHLTTLLRKPETSEEEWSATTFPSPSASSPAVNSQMTATANNGAPKEMECFSAS